MALPFPGQLIFLIAAGLVSGAVNAIAGGGSLLVFPALLAVGIPPLPANVTNSIAQWPGYLGMVAGARGDLRGQRARVVSTIGVAVAGAGLGCALLLVLPGAVFNAVVPALVVLASLLLAVSPRLRRSIGTPDPEGPDRRAVLLPGVFLGAVYGGYFGGALGLILISVLSLTAHDRLVRLNAVKAVLSLVIATVTVVIFTLGGPVHWLAVLALAPSTLVGGYLGMRLARVLPEPVLRWSVVALGLAVGTYLFLKPY